MKHNSEWESFLVKSLKKIIYVIRKEGPLFHIYLLKKVTNLFGCAGSWLLHRLSLVVVSELLMVVASRYGLQVLGHKGFCSWGTWA